MAILVTGGAGYIGSHVVRQLGERNEKIVVLDNLSTGRQDAILAGQFVHGDTADRPLLDRILVEHNISEVMHFAAHTVVPESVTNPLKYYANNTAASLTLLQACIEHGVKRFIFSSTAAVYGMPNDPMVTENATLCPINPYGHSKRFTEQMIQDVASSSDLEYVILRYFNVAGADLKARIGQSTPEATHLIKVVCEVLTGKRPDMMVFGDDYDTADGSCVRDFIHVEDLSAAHCLSLDYLRHGGKADIFNCGYGHGFSVKEVIKAAEKITEQTIPHTIVDRRPGDPAALIANSEKIKATLDWQPQYDDLNIIIKSALAWEGKL